MSETKETPFFIVGCPRSGTTLLQMLIDSHPSIAVPLESHIFYHFGAWVDSYGDLSHPENLKVCVRDLLSNHWIKKWKLNVTVDEFCTGMQEFNFRGVITRLFSLYAKQKGKVVWGDKTPEHALCLEKIKEVFPEAKIIHLLRDGRDIAASFKNIFFGPNTMDKAAKLWEKHVEAVETFKAKGQDPDFLEVRYEDLVMSPEREMKKIFQFLEVEESAALVKPSEERKDYFVKAGGNIHRSLSQPISTKWVRSFEKKLTPREIEIFESVGGDTLKKYGYACVSSAKPAEGLEKVGLLLKDCFLRYLRRINHWSEIRIWSQYYFMKWRRSHYQPK